MRLESFAAKMGYKKQKEKTLARDQATFRDKVTEVIKDIPMPDIQRRRILDKVGQLDNGSVLISWEEAQSALVPSTCEEVIKTVAEVAKVVIQDQAPSKLRTDLTFDLNDAFNNGKTLLEAIQLVITHALGRQSATIMEAYDAKEEAQDDKAKEAVAEMAFQILRDLNGVTENDLSPAERRRVEELVTNTLAQIFP